MSSKLVRKKKNKPKYSWMQDEIDAIVYRDVYDKYVAGYAVTMMQHVLEIGLWTLHDKVRIWSETIGKGTGNLQ